jgi:hypothetical protein
MPKALKAAVAKGNRVVLSLQGLALTGHAIDGRIVPGYGAASANIAKQLPKLSYQPVEGCHHGSMNILLKYPLRVTDPDHTTELIEWEPGNVEKFSLTKIDFECPAGGSLYPAWIYDSHNSPHRFNDYLVEVISQTVPGAAYGVNCRIRLRKPYKIYGVVIV